MNDLRVLMQVRDVLPSSGGLGVSVPALAHQLATMSGVSVSLGTTRGGQGFRDAQRPYECLEVEHWDDEKMKRFDLLHVNGLWNLFVHNSLAFARRRKIPAIVSIRGMLEPWALKHKWLKKRLAWWLYQRGDLTQASVLHATSEFELNSIRHIGLINPVCVIPNGVDLEGSVAEDLKRRNVVAFLGRLHPIKGLDTLLRAWSAAAISSDWRLELNGPDENGYQGELRALTSELGLDDSVVFRGAVHRRDKWAVLGAAKVFVLPSHSENFGLAAAEALSVGTPVIATHGTPWKCLEEEGCGWWVEHSVESLRDALQEATKVSDSVRAKMGVRGRQMTKDRFSWTNVARSFLEVYRWVLGQGERPESVVLD